MIHKNTTLAIVAIVATVTMTAVAFAVPQLALAGGYHHNHGNSIKVNQQIDQANVCSNNATCANVASNSADIDR
jgi:hypothetical protein